MDAHCGPFDANANSVYCRRLYNTDIHELPMPGGRPESDRYQKEEDKYQFSAYYIFIWPISNRLILIILLLQTCNGKWLSINKFEWNRENLYVVKTLKLILVLTFLQCVYNL